ncbi:MAG: diguanylate cyclase [bacterium]|nr:diguanylate cyclase [bacterium]MCM1374339.1 diguanylate cyclase [Muribaculum sp.]
MKKFMGALFLFAGLVLFFGTYRLAMAEGEQGRVLFISSYSYGWDTVQLQIEGIKEGMASNIAVDYEFMDTKRMDEETAGQMLYDRLLYMLPQVSPYDVIIVGDDAALNFAMEYREELFDGIPIVFEGVNNVALARELAEQDPLVTGVVEELSLEKNIDLALRLSPKTKKIIAILDNSLTGQAERESFYTVQEQYPDLTFGEINVSECSMMDLRTKLWQQGQDTILFFIIMTEDKDGNIYTNSEAVQTLVKYTNIPVMRMVDSGIEEGLLGGYVVSMRRSGMLAAQMASSIIKGTAPERLSVADSPNIYYINEEIMNKYDLDMDRLPENTQIINHEITFFEKYGNIVIPMVVFLIAMIAILSIVIYDNLRRRKLLQELEGTRSILESASQHDFLTGLHNRSKFVEDLTKLIQQEIPCTVFMLDIDDFKNINDVYGHAAGDDALKQVAERMKAMQSQILTPYRYAGDEFIMILLSEQGKIVEKTAYGCRRVFSDSFTIRGEKHKVTGSIGIASYPKDADSVEQLIICADKAMYLVKKSGKNKFAYFGQEPENI